jgi:hypothetical protein
LISPERPVIAGYANVASRLNYPKQKWRLLRSPRPLCFRCGSRHADMAVTGERR